MILEIRLAIGQPGTGGVDEGLGPRGGVRLRIETVK